MCHRRNVHICQVMSSQKHARPDRTNSCRRAMYGYLIERVDAVLCTVDLNMDTNSSRTMANFSSTVNINKKDVVKLSSFTSKTNDSEVLLIPLT